ncbi:unnamed protein product [Vitrella brassicaformis CCMP3155]|uniref:DNA topoisomerase n=1 Tax=Vitrella brassicaformis (strain CCMP3155) TaxID=1169540 RepID=A0A0G4F4M2_VITBC|nr:unnamed protein product [Vitrella brassicaformis CCMP3155]|eukprot:CEM06872.1 unnamed protein product [Vitrella brassicaformis CCMP3155]
MKHQPNVVVVESPAKAGTIQRYLGDDFCVVASKGHIRQLPSKKGSVDPTQGFRMRWTATARPSTLQHIVAAVKKAKRLYLATDPDREGEAIAWHVVEMLREKGFHDHLEEIFRVSFCEITKEAVQEAFKHPRRIDQALVDAYFARLALDYLVGFELSPVLWRKLPGSRSAGRVQSVALRLVSEREAEIERFCPEQYWTVGATFEVAAFKGASSKGQPSSFSARLLRFNGSESNGTCGVTFSTHSEVSATLSELRIGNYVIASVETGRLSRAPAPPFTTSTLQQEASRKLGFPVKKTMRLAQALYEGRDGPGLITYMRTDGVTMSEAAVQASREMAKRKYGASYVPRRAKRYTTRTKNAQEAHEAIRPTEMTLTADDVGARGVYAGDELKLYDLIWKRTIASQMSSAAYDQLMIDVCDTSDFASPQEAIQRHTEGLVKPRGRRKGQLRQQATPNAFRASGSSLAFDGFLRVYQEGSRRGADMVDDEGQGAQSKGSSNTKSLILASDFSNGSWALVGVLAAGEAVSMSELNSTEHWTKPPPRYSEASLVKHLEAHGIGRPSTYASIISTLFDRGYVSKTRRMLFAEPRGRLVTAFLKRYCPRYVAINFTANLERDLDLIATTRKGLEAVLCEFWHDFKPTVEAALRLDPGRIRDQLTSDLYFFLFNADAASDLSASSTVNGTAPPCPKCGKGNLGLRLGKHGAFVGCSNYPQCDYLKEPNRRADTEGDVSAGGTATAGEGNISGTVLGRDPETGGFVSVRVGPYGRYVQLDINTTASSRASSARKRNKPQRSALPTQWCNTVTLDEALLLLKLPAELGSHPMTGQPIRIGVSRYGVYVAHKRQFASVPASLRLTDVTLGTALLLLQNKAEKAGRAKPFARRGSRKKAKRKA